ncbi:MAG: rRNA maturation RNase YbeY [Trueperella sp.]|nr:rRNA maturation RNase YbeY [Trueperella sp.]
MIEVNDESGFEPAIAGAEISALATFVLDEMRVHPQADLSILLLDEPAMAELHLEWMNLPGPTDVMSFPMDELRPAPLGAEPRPGVLGDIAVCPQVAARQARRSGHATIEEVLLLVTHGILHLLGFDHMEDAEREEMFELQRRLLLTFLANQQSAAGGEAVSWENLDDIAPTVD